MSEDDRLNASWSGTLLVGGDPQTPVLSVQPGADLAARLGDGASLRLGGRIGGGETALLAAKSDVGLRGQWDVGVRSENDSRQWQSLWEFPDATTGKSGTATRFELSIWDDAGAPFAADEAISVTFAKAVARTEGTAELTLAALDGNATVCCEQSVPLQKQARQTGILSFTSTPPGDLMHLPGDTLKLEWATHGLNNVELQIGDGNQVIPVPHTGSYMLRVNDTGFTVTLSARDGPSNPTRKLKVNAVAVGWHPAPLTLYPGSPGYPAEPEGHASPARLGAAGAVELEPVNLFPAGDDLLYGAFRRRGDAEVLLFASLNPLVGWQLVPGFDGGCVLPAECQTSPGLYHESGRLWLFGGSQIDPDRPGNAVYSLDLSWRPGEKAPDPLPAWQRHPVAPWTPRMGHGVVAFGGRFWVIGGRDEDGNARADVWSMDVAAGDWTAHPKPLQTDAPPPDAPWIPRCLIAPVELDDAVWFFGGASEPFSSELYADMWRFDGHAWREQPLTGRLILPGQRPIASALVVNRDGDLCLFAKVKTRAGVDGSQRIEPVAAVLRDLDAKRWEDLPGDELKGWGGTSTFSYQVVAHRRRLLIARALRVDLGDDRVPVLMVYVEAGTGR